ncbi:hypothetical protein EPUS_04945 [Endocarpon pusillum Z07020]|uniref:Autophagy-related protein 101 n=1 Tax=Endocarpon pusillum (strain Z07020 / HMAS-L-300199) TaxID=1263415 RepID=U1GS10_ENDPU|nr:uncharacterized protein EPUS_04945 [Endocarpon pusillum Z07020]ERF74776.1 hypothetical protein EPUS_04945 [Endocarpon pusillum Z07020]
MEHRAPKEYVLEIFADQTFVKDIVKAVLHTIFFHRYFPPIRPSLRDLPQLDITLPYIADPPEIETLIDTRTTALVHQLTSADTPNGGVRGQIAIQFFEKRRRKTGGWLGGIGRGADEEVCWEEWLLEVTIAKPKTESERTKLRRAMESSLQKTAMKILAIVNRDKDHIPPITTHDANPFPYQLVLNPKQEGYGHRFGSWN